MAHRLETGGGNKRLLHRRGRRFSVSSQAGSEATDAGRPSRVAETSKRRSREKEEEEEEGEPERDAGTEGQREGERASEVDAELEHAVYLPETLEATVFLLASLQAVMTRAWDPAEAYHAAARLSAVDSNGHVATAAEMVGGAGAFGRGSVSGGCDSNGTLDNDEGDEDADALADTFVGFTKNTRKWDWMRCCHEPVNPALLNGGRGRGGGSRGGGSNAQPIVAPVAIDPDFCHRTLRPGKPGPEGCTLEQVRDILRRGWVVG